MNARLGVAMCVLAPVIASGCARTETNDLIRDTYTDPVDTGGWDTLVDGTDTTTETSCSGGLTSCGGECVDLMTDVDHCGSCDNACTPPGENMQSSCVAGSCDHACLDGYWDVDGEPGCEYECIFVAGTETCNGADDNCDGNADEGFPCSAGEETPCTTVCSTLGTVTCGDHCEIPPAEECTPPVEQCNGIDDDCDGETDEEWPPGTCGECVPECGTRECGLDPVCYTSCGTCDVATEICDSTGTCVCVPSCTGRECGPDPVCGTPCGTCTAPEVCDSTGHCVASCTPDCTGRECGPDPVCGTSCGTCVSPESCNASGVCECAPDCTGRECGPDPVCGTSCGSCVSPETCDSTGTCVGGCTPTTEVCNGLDDDCDSVADNGTGMECVRDTTGLYCTTGGGASGTQDCTSTCTLTACCAATESCGNDWDDDCDGYDDTEDTDCPIGPGTTCEDAIDVTSTSSWTGTFSDFPNYWTGSTGCAWASGAEVWFTATVPAGNIFTAEENSYTDVVIQHVGTCTSTACIDGTDSPESYQYVNDTGSSQTVILAVERYSGSSGSIDMTFSNEAPPQGYTCADAVDATSLTSWSGSLGDYSNEWYGSSSCGYASGREVWFTATVAPGDIFSIEETSGIDTVVERVSSCSSSSCEAYSDSEEYLEYHNDSGSPVTLWFIVEAYSSSSTGTIDVSFVNSAPPQGYGCSSAVDATSLTSWSGSLAGYDNSWSGYSCGYASGREVWFMATVAPGDIFTIEETSTIDTLVEQVSSCSATSCIDYTDSPEYMEVHNDSASPQTVYFVVEAYSSYSTGTIDVSFTNSAPPEGYGCTSAVDVTSLSTWSGSLADYDNSWSGGYSCGYAAGPEIWFVATVPSGNVFSIEQTLSTDVVIEQVSSCSATSCIDYTDTPEYLQWYNDTGSSATLTLIVEGYYSYTTGNVTLDFVNDPAPEGYGCDNAVDITYATSYAGDFADFQNTWSGTSCGYASGPEAWFVATVQPGDTLTVAETSGIDVILQRVTSCSATSCAAYHDEPENLSWTNSGASAVDVYIVVERYYDGTGYFTLGITNG